MPAWRAWTISENLAFRSFDVSPFSVAGLLINRGAIRAAAVGLIDQFRIRTPSPDARVETLSGGNVQRMVLARELSREVEVLIAVNPCFGLDIAAIGEIRSRITEVRNRGAAVLLVSEDLDELFELVGPDPGHVRRRDKLRDEDQRRGPRHHRALYGRSYWSVGERLAGC